MDQRNKHLLLSWDVVLQTQSSGIFDTHSFQALFEATWRYLIRHTVTGESGQLRMDTCDLPLITRVYEFSRRRTLPQTAPRREFEAAVTLCEGLVDSLSDGAESISDGKLKLCASWDVSKTIHIESFGEEFQWLCRYYQENFNY